jgi:hypothetical protein
VAKLNGDPVSWSSKKQRVVALSTCEAELYAESAAIQEVRFLGRASEAQIESFHASFNALFHKQHRNQSSDTAERLRRSLADATLRAVQPLLIPSPSHRS